LLFSFADLSLIDLLISFFRAVFSEEEPDLNNELEISVSQTTKAASTYLDYPPTFQTAETVESLVTQLMEKQRAARAASLNKQLECGGPPDSTGCAGPHQEQIATGGRVRATKSEAHTTSGNGGGASNGGGRVHGRSGRGGRGVGRGQASYAQVSSTTGNLDSRQSPAEGSSSPLQEHDHQMHGQTNIPPHLVLSVSQLQNTGGLIVLNNGEAMQHQHPHAAHNLHQLHMQQQALQHMVPQEQPLLSCHSMQQQHHMMQQHLRASAGETSLEGHQSASRPPSSSSSAGNAVSSAVRSLNSLSDFDSGGGGGNPPFDSLALPDPLLSSGDP